MAKVIGFVLMLAFGLAWGYRAAEAAPVGNSFCELKLAESDRDQGPTILGSLVDDSLAKDPSGNTPLDPKRCHMKTPATPNQLLQAARAADPTSQKLGSIKQLSAYYRSLVPTRVTERFWSACLKWSRAGWYPDMKCLARVTRKGETVWMNPETGKAVLLGDCSNPMMEIEVVARCNEIWVRTDETVTALRYFKSTAAGEDYVDRYCDESILRAGGEGRENPWFLDECPRVDCDWRRVDGALRQLGQRRIKHGGIVPAPGWQRFFVSSRTDETNWPELFGFCIEVDLNGDGKRDKESCTTDIWWDDYRGDIAVISFAPEQRPERWRGDRPRIWHFDHRTCMDRKW